MRILAVSLVILAMTLAGCVGYAEPEPAPTPEPEEHSGSVILPENPPMDRTWVSPGKVQIGNYYPGGRAEYSVTIHNGKDTSTEFSVSYRYPDNVATGYDKPPLEAQDWIIIADMTPILMPKETRDVLVALTMPKEAKVESKKWEFWISVIDMAQTGTIRTELCVRTLIDMR